MDDLLDLLDRATKPETFGPEYQELVAQYGPFEEELQKFFPLEYLNQIYAVQDAIFDYDRRESFARAFHLGAELALLIAGPAAPDTRHRSWACR